MLDLVPEMLPSAADEGYTDRTFLEVPLVNGEFEWIARRPADHE